MRDKAPRWTGIASAMLLAGAAFIGSPLTPALGQDTAGLGRRTGARPIDLWPPREADGQIAGPGKSIELGGWRYRAVRSSQPRDGVPWELVVTPCGEDAETWRKGSDQCPKLPAVTMATATRTPGTSKQNPDSVPIVVIPDILWKQWMASDLQDVVGIHFHEYVSEDVARILYTVHKVPPDGPDGKSPPAGSYPGRSGSRIEATLLAPLAFNLEQAIVARKDPLDRDAAQHRAEHEAGHAGISQGVLLQVLRGPQDWDPEYCQGRRSRLGYYWKRERIGRSWRGYRGGAGEILTLRTTVVVVPPTRWSILVPIPPERLTQKDIQAFNDAIVGLGAQFVKADHESQGRFHARHGSFEQASSP